MSSSDLSRLLNGSGKRDITCRDVRSIVKGLAELDAISTRRQAKDLLDLMECNYFSEADWEAEPLKKLKPDPTPARSIQQHPPISDKQLTHAPTISSFRSKYLERVSQQYDTFTLPIGKRNDFSLQAVFLPLRLRQDPLVAEDLVYEERRALLDEPTREEYDPRRAFPERQEPLSYRKGEDEAEVIIAKDAEDAIRKSPTMRLIILGAPGAGKSTMLRYLVVRAAQQARANASDRIPIYIYLPYLQPGQAIQGYLPILLDNLGIDINYARVLWEEIEQGRALICLDGLDEVTADQREAIIAWVNSKSSDEGNVWIVGSRFSQYKTGQFRRGLFSTWELQPLTPELRQALAKQLLAELDEQMHGPTDARGSDPSSFLHALEKHPQASNWGRNPLLFSLAAIVFAYYGTLPASRATLYQQVIDAVLETRQIDPIRRTMIREVVSSLALEFYQQKRRTFTRDDLLRLLPTIRERHKENWTTEELARQLINSGIFEVVAKETYGWWHQTFLEYLAAAELALAFVSPHVEIQEAFWYLAWDKRKYSRWIEILRLMVGILIYEFRRQGTQKALAWLHALVAQRATSEGDVGDLGLTLAIRSLSEIGETAHLWEEPGFMELEEAVANTWTQAVLEAADRGHEVRQARLLYVAEEIGHFNPSVVQAVANQLMASITGKNARIRKVIIQALGRLGRYAPAGFIMQALSDKHSKVREAAAYALAELEEYAPIDALIQVLKSENRAVRAAAMLALGEMRKVDLREILLPGLHDEDYSVREETIKALGKLGELAPVKDLAEMLSDKVDLVRLAAVEMLAELGEKTYDLLMPALDDPEDLVRSEVIKTLGKRTPVLKLIEEVTIPPAAIIHSSAYPVAADVLAELEEQDILNALATLENANDQELWELILSIRESRQEVPMEELIEALYDFGTYKTSCLSAAYILGRRNEWTILEQFFASLDKKHDFIRAIAVRLLGRLGEDTPVNLLLEALTDKNTAVRLAAIKALEDMEGHTSPEAVAVFELLKDKNREVRASALRVLAHVLGQVEVNMLLLETLLALTRDQYEPVRIAAKICLEKLGQRVTSEFIDNLFHHEDLLLCLASIELLGKYASFNQLVTAMQDRRPRVREATIHVLGQRHEQAAIGLLFAALKDRSVAVHKAAIQALERLGQRKALAERSAKGQLTPLVVTAHLALRDFKEWRILAQICNVEGLLTLHEVGTIPLEYLEELDAKMRFYSGLFGGRVIAVKTQMSQQQKLIDPEAAIRSEMFERLQRKALAMLKERATVDRLLIALSHENGDVRFIALHILADRTPMEQLIAALDDERIQVRREALQILGERIPIDLLISALNDESDIVGELALELLKQRRERIPEEQLIEGLESSSGAMRASAIKVLRERIPAEKLKAMLGDSEEEVRLAAADALRQAYPEILRALLPELAAASRGEGSSVALASAAKSFTIEIIEYMENASPFLIGKLTPLLDWPCYWEVRMRAAQALGKLRHNVPEEAIRRLIELRNGQEPLVVRRAADDALAEVLSLEAGIEEE